MKIIDGKYHADRLITQLMQEISLSNSLTGMQPTLAIIIVGNEYASNKYVNNKIRAASRVNIKSSRFDLPNDIEINDLLRIIKRLNENTEVSGIIIQLPLPDHINKNIVLSAIDPSKDVDGFHPVNVGYLTCGMETGFVPSTALGILSLIKEYESGLEGKNVVIIGRSDIVGRPLASLFLKEDCTVTICHSKTSNLQEISYRADIVISAIGKPKILGSEFFKSSAMVIDVGINIDPISNKITGDVDFDNVCKKVRYITPVPGGVGPMTVAFLLKNCFKAFSKQHQLYKHD